MTVAVGGIMRSGFLSQACLKAKIVMDLADREPDMIVEKFVKEHDRANLEKWEVNKLALEEIAKSSPCRLQ